MFFLLNTFSLIVSTSIKNNINIINRNKDIHIPPNAKLVAFDICNQYRNISVCKTINILKENVNKYNKLTKTEKLNTVNNSKDNYDPQSKLLSLG